MPEGREGIGEAGKRHKLRGSMRKHRPQTERSQTTRKKKGTRNGNSSEHQGDKMLLKTKKQGSGGNGLMSNSERKRDNEAGKHSGRQAKKDTFQREPGSGAPGENRRPDIDETRGAGNPLYGSKLGL